MDSPRRCIGLGVRQREAVLRETLTNVPWISKNKLVDQSRN